MSENRSGWFENLGGFGFGKNVRENLWKDAGDFEIFWWKLSWEDFGRGSLGRKISEGGWRWQYLFFEVSVVQIPSK